MSLVASSVEEYSASFSWRQTESEIQWKEQRGDTNHSIWADEAPNWRQSQKNASVAMRIHDSRQEVSWLNWIARRTPFRNGTT